LLLYAQHVVEKGRALSPKRVSLTSKASFAKLATAPYRATTPTHWLKIKNRAYSQAEGRHESFESRRAR